MIYVVTKGEYSDYGIRAIFTTHDLAQAYIDWRNGPDDEHTDLDDYREDGFRIEEYEEDSEVTQDTGAFVARFTYHEGADAADYHGGYPVWKPEEVVQRATADVHIPHSYARRGPNREKIEQPPCLTVVSYGPTPEHATRSGIETLRAIKARTLLVDGATELLTNGIIL